MNPKNDYAFKDLKTMNKKELEDLGREQQRQLQDLKLQIRIGKEKNISQIKKHKKTIARIKTQLRMQSVLDSKDRSQK